MRNKRRKEEKECREDMSQRVGKERENVRKGEEGVGGRGREGWRGEESFIGLPKSWFFSLCSSAAANGWIRDKRIRVETVYREKKGDPSFPK